MVFWGSESGEVKREKEGEEGGRTGSASFFDGWRIDCLGSMVVWKCFTILHFFIDDIISMDRSFFKEPKRQTKLNKQTNRMNIHIP